ncbi:bacteriocin biosynthesis docking scaffold, sagd family protein [Halogeometricum borinquense DSM 11551]|uniref:Bacteriocin biosynthesis docking scaffold, SagD family n=1 Tax=Halogeometricum borinquense (strain ATCC 700274 / DSM 11551 / JCM 10706 / KCTC 4070 / PR3) TaxID=469382 RepID=E4NSG4_HALBP|nr:YcaO-like family protein [Halogeometricum borinquense]ADQ66953.1 bacteriocin biosynthesis docking scaffold, SagD family [Halogeometricum borinquense DSM 11551]ELY30088.1 bacteriocin biosynthesis docking scaffold, sagd family protein [Halogeometricum borinquense DSM 11551]
MTTHDIALVGSGPAAEAVRAALADCDAAVNDTTPEDAAEAALAVVVAPAGATVPQTVGMAADRLVVVEIGGVGGVPLAELDAAVSVFAGTSRYADLCTRVAATTDGGDSPSGGRSAVRLAGAVAGRRAVALLTGDDSVVGTVAEISGTGVTAERTVLPVPDPVDRDRTVRRDYRDAAVDDSLARAERALDDRTGLVAQVGERESFPVPYYLAQTADTRGFSDARAAEFAAGVDPDWDAAFMKALGEALERYCAGVYRASEFTVAPERTRARPVSPARFVRPDSYRAPDAEEPIPWVDGENLATGDTVSVPAEFVHYPPPDTRHKPPITTGLGLGNSGTEALLSGLYEVIERDATILAWYSSFDPLKLDVADEGYRALVKRARSENLTATPLLVTQDVDVPVIAVAVHRDGEWPQFAMGSGASLDVADAARSALAEALQNWMELRSMGPERANAEKGAIGEYADFPDAARRFVNAGPAVPAASVGPDDVPSGKAELDAVVERVADAGLDPYAVRTTTTDVASLGFEAVRVLIPEAQPLFQGDPFFGARATSVPEELGFEAELQKPYHPYP